MKKFMIFMKGSQDYFYNLSPQEQQLLIQEHVNWSKYLKENDLFVEGNGFARKNATIKQVNSDLFVSMDSNFSNENEPSGYYIIKCDSMEEAIEIAKGCPALNYGELVEIIEIGH